MDPKKESEGQKPAPVEQPETRTTKVETPGETTTTETTHTPGQPAHDVEKTVVEKK